MIAYGDGGLEGVPDWLASFVIAAFKVLSTAFELTGALGSTVDAGGMGRGPRLALKPGGGGGNGGVAPEGVVAGACPDWGFGCSVSSRRMASKLLVGLASCSTVSAAKNASTLF